jgi:hypothetical protein
MNDPIGDLMRALAWELYGCSFWNLSRQEQQIVYNTAWLRFMEELS